MENYVNLHNHSIYSALDAVCTPEQLIDKATPLLEQAISTNMVIKQLQLLNMEILILFLDFKSMPWKKE